MSGLFVCLYLHHVDTYIDIDRIERDTQKKRKKNFGNTHK